MLLTIVTTLFLPLSFMATFFAINIDVFPKNDAGGLELGYVLEYMRRCIISKPVVIWPQHINILEADSVIIVSISAGLSITFDECRAWSILGSTGSFIANLHIGVWAAVALGSILRVVNWNARLSYAAKIATAITITVPIVTAFCCYYHWHLFPVAVNDKTSEPSPWKWLWMIIQGDMQQRARPSVVGTSHKIARARDMCRRSRPLMVNWWCVIDVERYETTNARGLNGVHDTK